MGKRKEWYRRTCASKYASLSALLSLSAVVALWRCCIFEIALSVMMYCDVSLSLSLSHSLALSLSLTHTHTQHTHTHPSPLGLRYVHPIGVKAFVYTTMNGFEETME